jgi:hypothetical protein
VKALWLALLGVPLAWTAQLVLGYGAEEADCAPGSGSWDFSSHTVNAVLFAVAGAVALAGLAGAMRVLLHPPPVDTRGRIAFMALGGVLVASLFGALIVMTGVGILSLEPCTPG